MTISYTGKTGSFVHEMTHGSQLLTGELNFTETAPGQWTPGNLYGLNDEVNAYIAEFADQGYLFLNNASTEDYLAGKLYRNETSNQVQGKLNSKIKDFNEITRMRVNFVTEGGSSLYYGKETSVQWFNN
jgi:hypothetical protein